MEKSRILALGLGLLSLMLTACSASFDSASADLASNISDNLGCANLKSVVYDSAYNYLEKNKGVLRKDELRAALKEKISTLSQKSDERERLTQIANEVADILQLMSEKKVIDAKEQLQFLIQLEFENQSTSEHRKIGSQIRSKLANLKSLTSDLALSCQQPPEEVAPLPPPVAAKTLTPVQFGGRFAFATAYQSCQVLDLPDITANTEDVVGIKKGQDVGGGYARSYASIPDIQRTHYYIRGISYNNGCFSVKDKPLVYDFGGEPAVVKTGLDFFTNAGTGGTALGLDCSAFISSAIAAAGLRYTPEVANKPIFVRQNSRDFVNPQVSGWKCFDRVTMTADKDLVAGDILAINGHVVMVDNLGADPFGIGKIKTKDQCAKLSSNDFDFSILQSSPSKASIGINRFVAKDYLPETSMVKQGFETYARAACVAKLSGVPQQVNSANFGLIRHRGTPECMAPRVQLVDQACISQCRDFR